MKLRFIPQYDKMDCGPACLSMIANYYGKPYSLRYLRENCFLTREGVSLLGISAAAQKIGFETLPVKLEKKELLSKEFVLPAILHWRQNHFVVLINVLKSPFSKEYRFKIADPGHGLITLNESNFDRNWVSEKGKGVALILQPKKDFYDMQVPKERKQRLSYLFKYLLSYKKSVWSLFILLFFGSLISLAFPFLTQNLIDKGVNGKDINFVVLILIAQLSLFLGGMTIELFRNWITLKIGTKINIQIVSDFLEKLLKLPIKFFDTKLMGDFNQRINDHERIERFLTSQSLLTFFSMITFSVFFGVLWFYDSMILSVYLGLSIVAVLWSLFWMRKRKSLDYFRFQRKSENQESIYEIINGVSEMKLNEMEEYKRGEWKKIQQKLFEINIRILKVDQVQLLGFEFINQLKNIAVSFIAATLVIKGNMSLGALLSVSYIVGQMNSPINQLIVFLRSFQDARLSLDRLGEVQDHPDEDLDEILQLNSKPKQYDFSINNLSYQYEGPKSPFVLKDINLHIPAGKVTAIVGASGSGKTTLMKLLLKFYSPTEGQIILGGKNLSTYSHKWLRQNSGVVMQEGHIFGDTIERNIIGGDEIANEEKLLNAVSVANIMGFIESLPLGLNTKIGASGIGISGGQKQRILIARAVYKNPQFLFFDEATSALDAENESVIHHNLQTFYKGKTVVIIAHRLSTVKKADQIIVLKNGRILEEGSHLELVERKNEYYNLVKNQLELGS